MQSVFEYELVTAPADTDGIATTAEAKVACGVTHSEHDTFIADLIAAAVALLDGPMGYLGQAIDDQEWTVRCAPGNVSGTLKLPFGPVSEVTAIKTHDGATLNTATLGDFRISYSKFGTVITPNSGSWPTMADREDALQITFNAGAAVGGPVKAVPPTVKRAVLMLVAHWYRQRETVVIGSISKEVEFGLQHLLANERNF